MMRARRGDIGGIANFVGALLSGFAIAVGALLGGCEGETPDTCESDLACDDGLACTVDRCEARGEDGPRACTHAIVEGQCLADGLCATAGAAHPARPCLVCDPATPRAWSLAADGASCEDGDRCTSGDTCAAGTCAGEAVRCDDGNVCTRDRCDPATGCVFPPLDGVSCDDGTRCTVEDRCLGGGCAGRDDACDDGDPCTVDACSEVEGCTHVVQALACDDGDRCTGVVVGDAVVDQCVDGLCLAGPPVDCDDGNTCTIDVCDADAGCVHLPTESPCCIGAVSVCDDGNPCTDDTCDPATAGCVHSDNRAPCDDRDPCTVGERCEAGSCRVGETLACDDLNPCTSDECSPTLPDLCLHAARSGACDDGIACTRDDTCSAGRCVGDASQCVCTPDLSPDGVKLTSILVGSDGVPGQGLDVDQTASTCAPASTCSGGIDNALSILASFANDALSGGVGRGEIVLVAEVGSLAAAPIEVAIYQARVAPSTPGCAVQSQTCDYLVESSFLDATTCDPVARLFATRSGDTLVGGGPGTRLPFVIPLGDAELEVVIAELRLEATITTANGQVTGMVGLLGGAVPKQTLLDAIQAVPAESLPVPKDALVSLVSSLIENDIDTDGDGVADAASIGIKLEAIDARLVGVAP
ncbi:MAG: hypothetical protein JNJ59_03315 [Deltaproteobacteria bacterium]|nr:hypothetical protein [Deltaproteobacteria bacterium]